MRIIGKDGKEYSDVKECLRAEKEYDERVAAEREAAEKEKKELEAKLDQEKHAISQRKKELSSIIEEKEEKYSLAQASYEDAKKKANDILAKARKEANDILQVAAKQLENASNEKMQAVADFNKEFGPYRTVVTGSKAKDEYNRVVNNLNNLFRNFWNRDFWF